MSFFRYAGGKSKLKAEILGQLNNQLNSKITEYREPFFGGGSIGLNFLANQKIKNFWINDKDIGLACLWTCIISYPEELKTLIVNYVPTVQSFFDIKSELLLLTIYPNTKDRIAEMGFKKLAIHQISYSGLGTKSGGPLGGVNQESNYKIDCRWSPEYLCKKIDKLHKQFSLVKLRLDSCTALDFSFLINDILNSAIIYLDPPYFIKGSDLYQHAFSDRDHIRLADSLKQTRHSWVLSYDDCSEIRELYKWATIKELVVNYSITATKHKETGERLSTQKTELLIWKK